MVNNFTTKNNTDYGLSILGVGTVNHAMKNEIAKIIESVHLAHM